MILRSKGLLLKIIGKLNATIKPIPATMYPIFLYKYPNIDISSVMLFLLFSNRGLYNEKAIAELIPNSAKLNRPNMFCSVDVKPTNSSPRLFMKIFLEKKVATSNII